MRVAFTFAQLAFHPLPASFINPGGASSSKRAREDTLHLHTKASTKQAKVSGGCNAYGRASTDCLRKI